MAESAAKQWSVERSVVEVRDAKLTHQPSGRELTYAALATNEEVVGEFQKVAPDDIEVTPVAQWKVLGASFARPNRRDLICGAHRYPSDIVRPGMLHGKILRPPSYGAKLVSIDLAPAQAMKDVVAVRDGPFVGVAAPTVFQAGQALVAIAAAAQWERPPHPSSKGLYEHLTEKARGETPANPFADELAKAAKSLRQTYHVAYVQHAPLEPRAAVAEWRDGKLTVWLGTQNPFGCRTEIARALQLENDAARVIVPDFGGGFGGKHSAEVGIEAARLAKDAGKPVALRWTREEEFTWAYFRPAGVINAAAGLDFDGAINSWHFVNINSGGSAVDTPYRIERAKSQFVRCD
jgi:isoquinoline 1-oxidoreductase